MENLIANVNPFTISKIVLDLRFERWYSFGGVHPYHIKLYKKKHPFLSKFFVGKEAAGVLLRPSVDIYGSDGSRLKSILCESKTRAVTLHEDLQSKLDDFVRKNRA